MVLRSLVLQYSDYRLYTAIIDTLTSSSKPWSRLSPEEKGRVSLGQLPYPPLERDVIPAHSQGCGAQTLGSSQHI